MSRFIMPRQGVKGQNLTPTDGAKLYFYEVGTVTPKDTYTDEAKTIPSSNPVIADAKGLFAYIEIDGSYDVKLTDKNDVTYWSAETIHELSGLTDLTNKKNTYETFAEAIADPELTIGEYSEIGERIYSTWKFIDATTSPGNAPNELDIVTGNAAVSFELIDSVPRNALHYGVTAGAAGSGPDVITDLQYAINKLGQTVLKQDDYKITSMLTVPAGADFRANGSNIYCDIADTTWAMLVQSFDASNIAQAHDFQLINVQTAAVAPAEANWRHGLCLGGSNGIVSGQRMQNFSGLSFAMGTDTVYSTTCPASTRCYYWDVGSMNVASMYGVNYYIGLSCNANNFGVIGTFPWNGFGQGVPRDANCLYELEIHGNTNTFGSTNFEASPLATKIKYGPTAHTNVFTSASYLEESTNWDIPTGPLISVEAGAAANEIKVRYAGTTKLINDLGTATKYKRIADFTVNSKVEENPQGTENLCSNPYFDPNLTGWSSFSTGATIDGVQAGNGVFYGNSYKETIAAGRPNFLFALDDDLVKLAALQGKTLTATCICTATLPVRLKVAGLGGNTHPADGTTVTLAMTGLVPSAATGVDLQIITDNSGLTGYVEVSDFMVTIGPDILSPSPLTERSNHTVTTAELTDINSAVNTSGKYKGRRLFNTTTNRWVYAGGTLNNSNWLFFDGTTAHTPI